MPKFPEPPSGPELALIPSEEVVLSASSLLYRIYFRSGSYGTNWGTFSTYGPTSSRFDHHLPPTSVQNRGILYAAERIDTCYAEVFQDTRTIDRLRNEPWLVGFTLQANVVLLDMTGSWCTKVGASMAINSGPRPRARRWSQAIYTAYPQIEGLLYPSSLDGNNPAIALYERALHAMPAQPVLHRALSDSGISGVVSAAAKRFNYAIW